MKKLTILAGVILATAQTAAFATNQNGKTSASATASSAALAASRSAATSNLVSRNVAGGGVASAVASGGAGGFGAGGSGFSAGGSGGSVGDINVDAESSTDIPSVQYLIGGASVGGTNTTATARNAEAFNLGGLFARSYTNPDRFTQGVMLLASPDADLRIRGKQLVMEATDTGDERSSSMSGATGSSGQGSTSRAKAIGTNKPGPFGY